MEKALKIQTGKEELVSAADIQREFHGIAPRDIRFICPICRQPLFPAAMTPKGKQAPHFRHERNNKRARDCELYASRYGCFSTYQRMPMLMFIRRSRTCRDKFIVEVGFRKLDRALFSQLEREGAKVSIGQKRYNVTTQRFGTGLTKLPLEEISLRWGASIALVDSSFDLNSTWGYPEDAKRAMVFSRDVDTDQGKRLNIGDTIPFESNLFLLSPDANSESIRRAFTGAHKVGIAGRRSTLKGLSVYEVKFTKDDVKWQLGKAYLEECGFEVADVGSTPRIIWPPALMASGDLIPLYKSSKYIFETNAASAKDDKLYIHTSADTADHVRTVPLRRAGDGCGFAVFTNIAHLSYVTARDWVSSSAVLLHPNDLSIDEHLHACDSEPRLSFSEGRWMLEASIPGEVVCYERNGAISILELSDDSKGFCFEDGSLDRIRIQQKLFASLDQIVVFEVQFEHPQAGEAALPEDNARAALIRLDAPNNLAFAISRGKGNRNPLYGVDRRRALIRKAGTQA